MQNLSSYQQSSRDKLISMLLPKTISHAVSKVPAYRKRINIIDGITLDSIGDLQLLPITTKDEMLSEIEDFRDNTLETALVQHTGGTSGKVLTLYRSKEEIDFLQQFYNGIDVLGLAGNPGRCNWLYISMFGNLHGEPTPIPSLGRVFNLDCNDTQWDLCLLVSNPKSVLDCDVDKIVLAGLESQLRLFTCRLIELGFDFKTSLVSAIISTGDHITPRLANWYCKNWRAPLVNQWSMSECMGGARPCAQCGHWHFDPFVIAEVVDVITHKPITEGYGALVVTCLYPFVQKQPLIRYWTGDLVEISPKKCEIANLGIRFAGRLSTCVFDSPSHSSCPLLVPVLVYDILDDYPDFASSSYFDGQLGISDHTALGHLKYKIYHRHNCENDLTTIDLMIECRYSPYMFPAHCQALIQSIWLRIVEAHPHLKSRLETNSVKFTIDLVPRGSLPRIAIAQAE
jgi:hypothetical protein